MPTIANRHRALGWATGNSFGYGSAERQHAHSRKVITPAATAYNFSCTQPKPHCHDGMSGDVKGRLSRLP